MIAYMIRNKTTGKFWNGRASWSQWADTGRQWRKKKGVEDQIAYYFRYHVRYKAGLPLTLDDWEIVEVDVAPLVQKSEDIVGLIRHVKIRQKLSETSENFSSFLSMMRDKGVEDTIEFIMDLEPTPGQRWVDRDRIKEARAQLRGMGIKTRTFREYRGMFGFLDRQQAMQARLVLNAKRFIDVSAIRKEVDGAV
jgi:hypothetical protein